MRLRFPRLRSQHLRFQNLRFLAPLAAIVAALVISAPADAADKVTFGTNWVAQAEHGGFYQAVVDGTYEKYGLNVTIVPGGPQANNRLLLPVGKIDFYMGANMLQAFSSVVEGIPTVIVAAMFQKDPQVLIAHPDVEKFEDLKTRTLFISKEGLASYYQWLVADYGFSENQVKPYTFNAAPFLVDKNSAMQGYITSEPYAVEQQGGFKPKLFLLADYGFDTYATTIETRTQLVEQNPDLVQRFVDASIIGWYNYLYGDNAKANALIKQDNPEMTDAMIAFSIEKMKAYGIVDSGDTKTMGIGAMTDARVKSFYDKMVQAKVVKPDIDYRKAYTLKFVDKGVGKELAK
ncbi:NMT1/THI5 like domain protein [Ancylobacter novellus DSM 506]|uniref:NMT1/THI5 like domain protein n=1 Tax=Ancylobacter novellus (strain ATCC 8093 / DSM 506 / JCM 20403 / CCM 1077 / IAM 12100 / NBRC 12443 / NCIMB 10456) TaxID=639283 RepID=D7A611_ANCN5|nr:ABC transporter substrate-binding protein [Ancylobacter novellus]ADH90126.1 NMT1/THI5 like domain protein [Ancylobacter novellus DSM 506]